MSINAYWFANVVSRNIAPLGGVLFLGWDARNVLLLYCVDTVLTMSVIFAGLVGAFLPGSMSSRRGSAKGAGTVIIPVMIAIVAATLPFVLGRDFDWQAAMADPAVRTGALWQAIAALWSCRDLIRALRTATPESLRLERRFGLVLSRWLTTVFVALVVVSDRFGHYGSAILVATYVVLSIWIEVAPHHFVAGMPAENGGSHDDRSSRSAREGSKGQRQRENR